MGFVCCRFTASFRFSEIANHICSQCWVEKAYKKYFFLLACLFVSCWISCVNEWAHTHTHTYFFHQALFCRFLFSVHELGNHVFGTLILAFAIGIYASLYVSFAHDKGLKLPIWASKYFLCIFFCMWKCFATYCTHTTPHTNTQSHKWKCLRVSFEEHLTKFMRIMSMAQIP